MRTNQFSLSIYFGLVFIALISIEGNNICPLDVDFLLFRSKKLIYYPTDGDPPASRPDRGKNIVK